MPNVDGPVVAVASTGARYFLRQLIEPSVKNMFVLSHSEIPPGTKVTSLGLI
jgi:flagellar biosynthesis component FlhA